jgi:NitT/TauT family transport system permease protein
MPPTVDAADPVDAQDTGHRPGDELAGLDALEIPVPVARSRARRIWQATWPKLGALGLGLLIWQAVVWSGWKPEHRFPPPGAVLSELWHQYREGTLVEAVGITLRRAFMGFALAVVIGTVLGALVARVRVLRAAVGSLVAGIQTMPSVAWVPWAILLFQISEEAILFVTVIGAAPAVASGLISGHDQIPPILLRAGRTMGARGLAAYRHVVLPASLPGFMAGLKQGWAFAWRSLMAGEIIALVSGSPSVGWLLQNYRTLNDAEGVMAMILTILAIGIVVDSLIFAAAERAVLRRWGLAP